MRDPERPLTDDEVDAFRREDVVVATGFYDCERELDPIPRGIHDIISLVAEEAGVDVGPRFFTPERFDAGFPALLATARRHGGTIYDAVKQLAPFVRLVASAMHEAAFRQLRGDAVDGVAAGGFGIRIDNPGEDFYGAPWHQEYLGQLRSLDGCVLWAPLRAVTPDLGPVEVCLGSHRDGPRPVTIQGSEDLIRAGAYPIFIHEEEEEVIDSYEHAAPTSAPGDLILMDFLTIHRSGINGTADSRWSMQSRLFNFDEPTGRSIRWSRSFASGRSVADVLPELIVSEETR